jgi:2-C-methyl-D-erythritol 2,4-cyclodiphosphate synthase
MSIRIGHSHDTHRFGPDRKLILGGVEIPYSQGLIGHSDADCVYHVVSEAIIGALGLGDLGVHFPDNDQKYENIASSYFVSEARKMMEAQNYHLGNLDLTIFLENPILKNYKNTMRDNIANLLGVRPNQVNVKATRGEGLGFIGRGEGVSAECVVLLEKNPEFRKL